MSLRDFLRIIFFLSSNIPSSPAYGDFLSQLIRYARTSSSYECFILRAVRLSNKLFGQGYVKERLRFLWSVRGSYQTIWGRPIPNVTQHSGWWPSTVTPSIDQALHQFLTLLLILTLLPNLTFYLIARGFHRRFATGAACQQRTLTPPDTWSCLTLGLANVLLLRPMSHSTFRKYILYIFNNHRYVVVSKASWLQLR